MLKDAMDSHFANRYTTWMAAYQMVEAPLKEMAENLEKASMVILCVSRSYESSQYCLSEASMAYNDRKQMLVLIMEERYDIMANIFLKPIVSIPMRKNCSSKAVINANLEHIFMAIEKGIEKAYPPNLKYLLDDMAI